MKMSEDGTLKRRRVSTGGTAQDMGRTGRSYAHTAALDVSAMSDSEKLNFAVQKLCSIETLTLQLQRTTSDLSEKCEQIDQMAVQMSVFEERAIKAELRIIDLEARSRRNNLVFFNIAEPQDESDDQCEEALFDFFYQKLHLTQTQLNQVVFQRAHRLGQYRKFSRGGAQQKPRPIIAGFRDYKCRKDIFDRAKLLKGTDFAIREDFPAEIRTARGELWPEFRRAREANMRAKIVYPAKLVINGEVVKDKFPQWGKWYEHAPKPIQRNENLNVPRSGSPMEIPLVDFLQNPPRTRLAVRELPPPHENRTTRPVREAPPPNDDRTAQPDREAPPPHDDRTAQADHEAPPPQGDGTARPDRAASRGSVSLEDCVDAPAFTPQGSRQVAARKEVAEPDPPDISTATHPETMLNESENKSDIKSSPMPNGAQSMPTDRPQEAPHCSILQPARLHPLVSSPAMKSTHPPDKHESPSRPLPEALSEALNATIQEEIE